VEEELENIVLDTLEDGGRHCLFQRRAHTRHGLMTYGLCVCDSPIPIPPTKQPKHFFVAELKYTRENVAVLLQSATASGGTSILRKRILEKAIAVGTRHGSSLVAVS
jgi:hypothetical protein